MTIQSFNDFEDDNYQTLNEQAFQFREDKTEDGTLEWLNNNFSSIYNDSYGRFLTYRRHLALFKNMREYEGDGFMRASNRDRQVPGKKPAMKMNYAYEYTEARVSEAGKQKINVAVIPRNASEQKDINNAKACKMMLTARSEEINLDDIHQRTDRMTYLLGMSFLEVCWDKTAGAVSPAWIAAKEMQMVDIPEYDSEGNETGERIKMDPKKPIKIGDVSVKLWAPYRCFPERGQIKWEDVNHIETTEWMDKEEVKKRWPGKAHKIDEAVNQRTAFDFANSQLFVPRNQVMIRTFWHRPTQFFPEGCKIVYCDQVILDWDDFPYNDAELPFVPDTDVDVPDEFWGRSFLINIEQLIRMYNNVLSGMARNHGVSSAPKWMYPEGSVNNADLNNQYGGVPFKGPQAPQLVRYEYLGKSDVDLTSYLETRMGKLSAIFKVSQGEVPPGVTAASAIRYLDDQNQQRMSTTVAKRKKRILEVYRKMIARMGQYYRDSDHRMVRLLGKNNEYMIKSFKQLRFNDVYDVRIENIPWISDSKSGRIADIIDLNAANQKDPLFGKEEMIELLDLGLDDAYKDEATYGVDTGRTILEMLQDGEQVPPPTEADNLLAFMRIFYRFIESIEYKFKTEPQIVQAINEYVGGIELLCWEQSQKNAKFAMELQSQFSKFPVFFQVPAEDAPEDMGTPAPAGTPVAQQATAGMDPSQMKNTQDAINQEMKQQGELGNA